MLYYTKKKTPPRISRGISRVVYAKPATNSKCHAKIAACL
jgi:hypothetical protein